MADQLWCVHAPGGDHVPVPSRAGAELFAAEINDLARRHASVVGVEPAARVVPWTGTAAEHHRRVTEDQWPEAYFADTTSR